MPGQRRNPWTAGDDRRRGSPWRIKIASIRNRPWNRRTRLSDADLHALPYTEGSYVGSATSVLGPFPVVGIVRPGPEDERESPLDCRVSHGRSRSRPPYMGPSGTRRTPRGRTCSDRRESLDGPAKRGPAFNVPSDPGVSGDNVGNSRHSIARSSLVGSSQRASALTGKIVYTRPAPVPALGHRNRG